MLLVATALHSDSIIDEKVCSSWTYCAAGCESWLSYVFIA